MTKHFLVILAILFAFIGTASAGKGTGPVRSGVIPQKQTFTVKDPSGRTIRCSIFKGENLFVLKDGGQYIFGARAIRVLNQKLSRSSGKDKKNVKFALTKLRIKVDRNNRLCNSLPPGGSTPVPGVPTPGGSDPNLPTSLEKLSRAVTSDDVLTLVDKAGFGLGANEERLVTLGTQNGIDALVDEFMRTVDEPAGLLARVEDELDGSPGKVTTQSPTGQRQALIDLWIHTKNPYAERLAMALLGIWTVGGEVIEDETFRNANWDYMTRLRSYSRDDTDLAALAHDITHDPLMILYLNNSENSKDSTNENYARELMELFTMGPVDLDKVPNYTETNLDGSGDIPTAARILTGWTVKKDYIQNKLVAQFVASRHDDTPRVMFAGKPWQFSARNDDDLVSGIFSHHPAVKTYYAQEILKLYLTPTPPRALVEAFGKVLSDNGYKLRPAMRALFVSSAFYDPAFRHTVPTEPYTFAARAARTLRLENSVNLAEIEHRTSDMGFAFNLPPSVFWYPQSAWNSSSTLLEKANLVSGLLSDSTAQMKGGWQPLLVLPTGTASVGQVIDFVIGRTHLGTIADPQRQSLISFITRQLQYDGSYTTFSYDNTKPEHQRVKGLGLYFLMLMSPHYQVL